MKSWLLTTARVPMWLVISIVLQTFVYDVVLFYAPSALRGLILIISTTLSIWGIVMEIKIRKNKSTKENK